MQFSSSDKRLQKIFLFPLARIACLLHIYVKTSRFHYSIWATPNNKIFLIQNDDDDDGDDDGDDDDDYEWPMF